MQFLSAGQIVAQALAQFWPVWLCLAAIFGAGLAFRGRLGLFGRLFHSGVGMAGLGLVLFWALTAVFADVVAVHDPLAQFGAVKRQGPGVIDPVSGAAFLFGADNLGRDLFSRVAHGAQFVLIIAPAATLVAYAIGVALGLPAGYFGGRIDAALSFLANLVLAFPVILLFYLLVTPGVRETAIPNAMAGVFFLFPLLVAGGAIWLRYAGRRAVLIPAMAAVIGVGGWLYVGLVFAPPGPFVTLAPNVLNIFAAVVFASSPGVFRIVRGLTMDIRTRDYIAAAQTRGTRLVCDAVGDIAQRARAADRGWLPAHRLHHHPARHAGVFRAGAGAGKPRLGLDDQPDARLHPAGRLHRAAADAGAGVAGAGAEPAGRRPARTGAAGLSGWTDPSPRPSPPKGGEGAQAAPPARRDAAAAPSATLAPPLAHAGEGRGEGAPVRRPAA